MNRVSELFIVGYEGTEPPADLRRRFGRGEFAGLIFFRRNFAAPDDPAAVGTSLRPLGSAYQPEDPELAALPPIFAIDQEGGRVQRLRGKATVWPPMLRLAEHPPERAEAVGQAIGRELLAIGLNVDFAPVLDVMTNPQNPIIGDRAFGTEPAAASERALAFLRGLESVRARDREGAGAGGVRGCGKHFPGHGDTTTDSHLTLPVVPRDEATLRAVELAPFAAAVRAGVGMLMTAHVVYPAVDARPATLSRRWLTDILRGELGFEGLVVSDDLDMSAVTAAHLGIADDSEVVVEALLAGCDAFLFCRDPDRLHRAEEALQRAAERSAAVRDRLAESSDRLRALRRTLAPCRPDEAYLRSLPDPAHQRLADALRG
jgi:beta-N-acetylhexosaminidase